MKKLFVAIVVMALMVSACKQSDSCEEKSISCWSSAKSMEWQQKQGWLVGCNYIPASAVNQLEMWQKETFDTATIERELALASDLGFNLIRVFLHDLMWDKDSAEFLLRIDQFLSIADKHNIKTMLVFFDDCWYGNPQRGTQPEPISGLHNSGWLQSPAYAAVMNKSEWPRLENYVIGVINHFKNDERIILWDLYNEPANNHYPEQVFPLVREVFAWARSIKPSQPLTVCKWRMNEKYVELVDFCLQQSDVISFHNYSKYEDMAKEIANLKSYGKPVLCSEYLARGYQSNFETILPLLKKENVGAVNWGFVDGKTQTKYHWDHPYNDTNIEPWHHEIFRSDLSPYRKQEVDFIKETIKIN